MLTREEKLSKAVSALRAMRRTYGALHDGLNDMIGEGEGPARLTPDMIPDDYHWLADQLAECVYADYLAKTLLDNLTDE